MFKRRFGEPNIAPYKKKASTAFAKGDLCVLDANGLVDKATATTTRPEVIGVIQRDVLSTDSDYAENSFVAIDVVEPGQPVWEVDVSTGTPAQTDVGEVVELDDADSIDVVATTVPVVKVEKIISSTKVLVSFPYAS